MILDILWFSVQLLFSLMILAGVFIGVVFLLGYAIKTIKWGIRKEKTDESSIDEERIQPVKRRTTYYIVRKRDPGHGDESGEVFDGLLETNQREEEYESKGTSDVDISGADVLDYGRLLSTYSDARRKDRF